MKSEAQKEALKAWRANNKEAVRQHNRTYYAKNREAARAQRRQYYARNKEAQAARMKRWHAKNRDAVCLKKKAWYAENRELSLLRNKAWYADPENKEAVRLRFKTWYAKNKEAHFARNRENLRAAQRRYRAKPESMEKIRVRSRAYSNRRYKSDPNFCIMRRLRPRLRKILRDQGASKIKSALALVGCTPQFLRGYLEGQFKPGMTWANVHIDHHIPCAAFDLRDPKQQKQCFHFSNLRPLLALDNLKKGSRVPPQDLVLTDLKTTI